MFLFGLDLNSEDQLCHPAKQYIAGVADARRQVGFRAVDGAFAADDVSALRGPLSRRVQGQDVQLPRSVPLHGVCAVGVSREPARDRGVSAGADPEALSNWNSQQKMFVQYPVRR